jgi:nucleoside-diphosphate-sugar epimerase
LSESDRAELSVELDDDEIAGLARSIRPPVAVTGGTGFVGSHLLDALVRSGLEVRALIRDPARLDHALRNRVQVVRGDLTDAAALGALVAGAGAVLHVAGLVRSASAAAFERVNRLGTERLVACVEDRAPGAFLVYVSSLSAAGPSPSPAGLRPQDPPRPISAYGRSKLGGERALAAWNGAWAIVRPPAVYGPRDVDVLQFFRLAAHGLVPLPAGKRWITVAHVADVVRGILAAAAGDRSGTIVHLGEPEPYRLDLLIGTLAKAGDVTTRILPLPAAAVRLAGAVGGACMRIGFSGASLTIDKARELLARHWTAQTAASLASLGLSGTVPFANGARQTWAWYRARGWVPHAKIRPT